MPSSKNQPGVVHTPEPIVSRELEPMTKGEIAGVFIPFAFVGSILAGIVYFGIKEEKRMAEERRKEEELEQERRQAQREEILRKTDERVAWMNEESERGRIVYELKDGQYLVVDRTADQKIKRFH